MGTINRNGEIRRRRWFVDAELEHVSVVLHTGGDFLRALGPVDL